MQAWVAMTTCSLTVNSARRAPLATAAGTRLQAWYELYITAPMIHIYIEDCLSVCLSASDNDLTHGMLNKACDPEL
jgi:hypothetical protein